MKPIKFLILLAFWQILPTFAQAQEVYVLGNRAEFHPYLLRVLKGLSEETPSEALWESSLQCEANYELDQKLRVGTCSAALGTKKALKHTTRICEYIKNPLVMYGELPERRATSEDTQSIGAMLKLFGAPVARTKLPSSFVNRRYQSAASVITLRVFHDEYLEKLVGRMNALRSLKKESNCASSKNDLALINGALAEIAKVTHKLQTIQKAGLKKAAEQNLELAAKGKKRNTLPYPSLTYQDRWLLTMFLSSMAWRTRGGGVYEKIEGNFATQKLRINYIKNSYHTLLKFLGAGSLSDDIANSLYLRGFAGWHDYFDLGTREGSISQDYYLMSKRGEYQVAGVIEYLKGYGYNKYPVKLAGTEMGACYLYGYHQIPRRVRWGGELRTPYEWLGDYGGSWGELCFGAGLGIGLAESLLGGYHKTSIIDKWGTMNPFVDNVLSNPVKKIWDKWF